MMGILAMISKIVTHIISTNVFISIYPLVPYEFIGLQSENFQLVDVP